ncbi:MAG: PilZ domain-containing protein [Nitrospirota bacterium]
MERERGYKRTPRFTKRLEATFSSGQYSFRGILSNVSESGLFIRTNRGFTPGTTVDIELMLPDNQVSRLKGIVRRTIKQSVQSSKNGMGVELIMKDDNFIQFVRSVKLEQPERSEEPVETTASDAGVSPIADSMSAPEFEILSCPVCGVKNKIYTAKRALGPKCGRCGNPLLQNMR